MLRQCPIGTGPHRRRFEVNDRTRRQEFLVDVPPAKLAPVDDGNVPYGGGRIDAGATPFNKLTTNSAACFACSSLGAITPPTLPAPTKWIEDRERSRRGGSHPLHRLARRRQESSAIREVPGAVDDRIPGQRAESLQYLRSRQAGEVFDLGSLSEAAQCVLNSS